MSNGNRKGRVIDRERTPDEWPTVLIPSDFWEEYGRVIGTFAVLEHTLNRHPSEASKSQNKDLKSVAMLRNAMCHGSWVDYKQDTGVATLRYWRKKGWRQGDTSQPFSKDDLEEICRVNLLLIFNLVDDVEEWHTDHIPSAFWEEYGRTIGTLTALEDNLMRAHFKITSTRGHTFQTDEQAKDALADWQRELEESVNEPMGK